MVWIDNFFSLKALAEREAERMRHADR